MSTNYSKRILVIDDDPAMYNMLRLILVNEGYEVIHATSGEEALELALRQSPRLVISDVMLPGMDGFAFCRRLRQMPLTHTIPVLMLTSRGEIADKIAGFEAGADDYLT